MGIEYQNFLGGCMIGNLVSGCGRHEIRYVADVWA